MNFFRRWRTTGRTRTAVSLESRTRIVREVVTAVRKVWSGEQAALPAHLRDRLERADGWTIEQSVELAKMVQKPLGVDLIDCSSGAASLPTPKFPTHPGYQTPTLRRRNPSGSPALATGAPSVLSVYDPPPKPMRIIRNPAKRIWSLMAREFLRDPYFPLHAAAELHQGIHALAQAVRTGEGEDSKMKI